MNAFFREIGVWGIITTITGVVLPVLQFSGVVDYKDVARSVPYPFSQKVKGCLSNAKDVNISVSNAEVFFTENKSVKAITDEDGCYELAISWKKYEETLEIQVKKDGFCKATEHVDLGSKVEFSLYEKEQGKQCLN